MEFQATDPQLLRSIRTLQEAAARHLENPEETITSLSYRITLPDYYLMLRNRTEGFKNDEVLNTTSTNISLHPPEPHPPKILAGLFITGDTPGGRLELYQPDYHHLLQSVSVGSDSEQQAIRAIISLWQIASLMPDKRTFRSYELQDYMHLGQLSAKVIEFALPLLSQGALSTSSFCKSSTGNVEFETYAFSGQLRHTNAFDKDQWQPLLRATTAVDDQRYLYEKTSPHTDTTRTYPVNHEERSRETFPLGPPEPNPPEPSKEIVDLILSQL